MTEVVSVQTQDQVRGNFANERKDKWWSGPSLAGFYLIFLGLYVAWALFIAPAESFKAEGTPYVSPIFAPEIGRPDFWPLSINILGTEIHLATALLIIWIPFGFRATCYYCRKVYYRSFFLSPPACSVDGVTIMKGRYKGEKGKFNVFFLNNFHRFLLYLAIILAALHWIDTLHSANFVDEGIGIGIGTIIIALDAFFLTLYVISCHSFRHLAGGRNNTSNRFWSIISRLNEHHRAYFWLSITTILIADLYIRLLAGVFPITFSDVHIILLPS